MRALILAAGRGSRMGNLTESRPKCLLKVHNKTLLQYQIDALKEAGIDSIGIVVGYKKEALMPYISKFDLQVFENPIWQDSNMIHSLMCAKEWLLEDKCCIISYSDIFYQASAIKLLQDIDSDMGILYDINWLSLWQKRFSNPLSDAESFIMLDGILKEIGSKVDDVNDIQGQYMGLLAFSNIGLERFLSLAILESSSIDTTSLLQQAILQGESIKCVPYSDIWGECDSPSDIALYERLYFKESLI